MTWKIENNLEIPTNTKYELNKVVIFGVMQQLSKTYDF